MKKNNLEKSYRSKDTVQKLRRLADALEAGKPFNIQISGQRIRVSGNATVEIEYEKRGATEEIEIEVSWKRDAAKKPAGKAPVAKKKPAAKKK